MAIVLLCTTRSFFLSTQLVNKWRLISVESMLVQPCVSARYIYISSKRHSYAYPAQNLIGVIIQYGLFFTYCRNLEVVQMLYKAL